MPLFQAVIVLVQKLSPVSSIQTFLAIHGEEGDMIFNKRSVFFTLILLFQVSSSTAGNFSDSFKAWVLGAEAEASIVKPQAVKFDNVTSGCMECHNGEGASHVTAKSASSAMQFMSSGAQVNHPIGMIYGDYVNRMPGQYKSPAMMNKNINFVDGMVACTSCHLPKSQEHAVRAETISFASFNGNGSAVSNAVSAQGICTSSKNLTVGPKQSDLCMACHNM